MFAVSVQVIPVIRLNFLKAHRILGRNYFFSAFMASICIKFFVFSFRTSRKDIREEVGNIFFAVAAFVSYQIFNLYGISHEK